MQKGQHMEEFLQTLVEKAEFPAPQARYTQCAGAVILCVCVWVGV